MAKLKRGLGWLPTLIGLATWVLGAFFPVPPVPYYLLGLFTSIAISVAVHEISHFLVARFLGLNPWWLSIGYGEVVFEKRFRTTKLTLKEFPYSGRVFPFVLESEENRARWKLLIMVVAGPVSNGLLLVAFGISLADFSATTFSNWQLISLEMCVANAYLLLVSLIPSKFKMHGAKIPNDGLHLASLLFSHWRGNWAKKVREEYPRGVTPSWSWMLSQVDPDALLNEYRKQLNNPILSQDQRALALDGFATCVLMCGAKEFLPEADRHSQELLQLKPAEWTVKGTRGSILVEKGELDHGMTMLSEVMEHDPSTFDRAIAASFLALGELKKNNPESALKWLRVAHDLDADCASARRIQSMLDQQNLVQ